MSDTKSSSLHLSKQAVIGLVGGVTIALFVWFAFFLKGHNVLSSENIYYAIYNSAGDLRVSSPIMLNGLKIGRVDEVDFVSETDIRIKATLKIQKKYRIPEKSIASLEATGLLGGSAIIIRPSLSTKEQKPKTYFLSHEEPNILQQIGPLKDKMFSIVNTLDTILGNVNQVLRPSTVKALNESFASLSVSLKNIEAISGDARSLVQSKKGQIGDIITNLDHISRMFKDNSGQIENVILNLSKMSDTLAQAQVSQTLQSLTSSIKQLETIVNKVSKGEGSVGQLLSNESLYQNLEESTSQLKLLLEDIRINPGRYIHISVFGKKDKTPPLGLKPSSKDTVSSNASKKHK